MKKFSSLLFLVCFFLFLFSGDKTALASERIEGMNRYSTAVEISKEGWSTSHTVVLVKGTDFPDALAGGPLAFLHKAPILLTEENRLTAITEEEIKRLEAKKVIILGSTVAVSQAVSDRLKSIGLQVERIGGANRYETAALIAERLNSTQAVIAYGGNFPDVLSAAPYAAKSGIPILLTKTEYLPAPTIEALKGKTKTIVLGGTGAVGEAVLKKLPNPIRYGGTTRYDTAKEVTTKLNLGKEEAYIATGESFADALAGSVLAARKNAPILLVKSQSIPPSTKSLLPSYKKVTILGGNLSIGTQVQKELGQKTNESPKVPRNDADKLKSVSGNNQLILVTTKGYSTSVASIQTFERNSSGTWDKVLSAPGYIGKNGFARTKVEGDGKSPRGKYTIGTAFGQKGNPGTKLPFRSITKDDVWVDDPKSPLYNTWQSRRNTQGKWKSAENMAIPQYNYGFVINYNTAERIPGAGSAIFFHVATGYTLGCTGVSEANMVKILKWIDPSKNPVIIQTPAEELLNY